MNPTQETDTLDARMNQSQQAQTVEEWAASFARSMFVGASMHIGPARGIESEEGEEHQEKNDNEKDRKEDQSSE